MVDEFRMRPCHLASSLPQRREAISLDVLTRREWVKRFVVGTVAATGAEVLTGTLLADIYPSPTPINTLTFKLSDSPAHRGLGDPQQAGRAGEASRFHHSGEDGDVVEIEHCILHQDNVSQL